MDATERRTYLRAFRSALDRKELPTDDPRYVELYEPGRAAIDLIASEISLSVQATSQLLTGPRGSGKTTELNRLVSRLRDDGMSVVFVNVEQYLSTEREIGLIDFLAAVAVGVAEQTSTDDERPGVLDKLWALFKRLRPDIEATVKTPVLDVKLGARLKEDDSFIYRLREQIDPMVGPFVVEIHKFLHERLPAVDGYFPVLVVDSIEKIRGDRKVMESVRRLFAERTSALLLPFAHSVYTVPPYLSALEGGVISQFNGGVRLVGMTRVDQATGEPAGKGADLMVEVINRRQPNWEALLGDTDLRVLVGKSGGHLRILFLLLEQLIVLTASTGSVMPVPATLRADAEAQVRRDYDNLTAEDAALLTRLHTEQHDFRVSEDEQERFARLLDAGTILTHLNGKLWYAVHPLARDALGL